VVSTGEKAEEIKKFSFGLDQGVIGLVATGGKPQIVNDAPHDERHLKEIDEVLGYETYNILAVPMKVRDRLIGVMEVLNRTDGELFWETDTQLLSIMANQAAILIEYERLFFEFRQKGTVLKRFK